MVVEVARILALAGAGAALWVLSPVRQIAFEPAAVHDYIAAHHRLEGHQVSVQQLYHEAIRLHDQLLQRRGTGPTLLERLSPKSYEGLERRLKPYGIVVNREEVVFVAIEPAFFLALAKRYGTASDVEFFDLYGQLYPGGTGYIWPAYIEQQTDYSGCTSFAPHKLVDLYGRWKLYRSRLPGDYQKKVKEAIEDIESQLGDATCACEGHEIVAGELRTFLARFPNERIVSKIAARLRAIEDGHSTITFHCLSS